MPSFNKVMMIGNLTRDPQVKNLPSGVVLAEFGLAMSRKYRTASGEDKEEVCFVDCAAFGKQAETIAQWCRKGKPLFVEGRLKYDTWEDRLGGQKRHKLSVTVENFQFLGSRSDDANGGAGSPFGGASASGGHPGATTPDMFQQKPDGQRKPDGGAERPAGAGRRGRGGAKQNAEQPFGDEKMFEEADIPF
jgi:single-strand DNA-binding protein